MKRLKNLISRMNFISSTPCLILIIANKIWSFSDILSPPGLSPIVYFDVTPQWGNSSSFPTRCVLVLRSHLGYVSCIHNYYRFTLVQGLPACELAIDSRLCPLCNFVGCRSPIQPIQAGPYVPKLIFPSFILDIPEHAR